MYLGTKLKQAPVDKLVAKLQGQFREGESTWYICSINSLRLLADRLIVTDQRVMAVSSSESKIKWWAEHSEVLDVTLDPQRKSASLWTVTTAKLKFGSVHPDDQTSLIHYLNHARETPLSGSGVPSTDLPAVVVQSAMEVERAATDLAKAEKKRLDQAAKNEAKAVEKARREAERARQRAIKAEQERLLRTKVGNSVHKTTLGAKSVEVFAHGFVKLGLFGGTNYETLISITADKGVQDKSAGGRAVAAVATMGVSSLFSGENFKVFVTVVTEENVHSIQTEGAGEYKKAMALAAAGTAVVERVRANAMTSHRAVEPQPSTTLPSTAPNLAEQLREIASLYRDGILTDDEYVAAKAKLLNQT